MVLLKSVNMFSNVEPYGISTFHYGSIKITCFHKAPSNAPLSTFHYGSIKIATNQLLFK